MGECDECRYFEREGSTGGAGYCLRYPPKVFLVGDEDRAESRSFWPQVDSDNSCGEFVRGLDIEMDPIIEEGHLCSIADSLKIIAKVLNNYSLERFG
jgi:hypothetical protein